MRVLIADDEPETRELVSTILRKAGFDTIIARDAMETVAMAVHKAPDLIVLDVLMPAGTGAGALDKLKRSSRTQHIPVVVLSGITERGRIDRLLELGAVEFLSKPVDPDALLSAVRAALNGE